VNKIILQRRSDEKSVEKNKILIILKVRKKMKEINKIKIKIFKASVRVVNV